MNVLATPEINTQNIFLFTGPRGNELIMPGFANQKLGKFYDCAQEVDNAALSLCSICCKPVPLPMGRSLIPCACRQDILYGHT